MQVISRIALRGRAPASLSRTELAGVLPRAATDVEAAVARVRPICDDVRSRGAEAVREYTARFDGVDLATTRVPRQALEAALAGLDPEVRAALEEAARRTRRVHGAQIPAEIVTRVTGGLTVTGRFVPVGRAGVYVPGGLVAYPSSVVMNIVPAQAAGVASVAVASPPQVSNGGLPHPSVLAACALLGVTEVHAAGDVDAELTGQVAKTRHRERVAAALAGQSACVLVDDLDAALAVSDAWAPEHLEIQARDAAKLAARVTNAGAVFAGPYSPVSLGDYLAGSNHVLPTGGTARHTSGLSVFPFLRLVNVVECDRGALAATAPLIDALGGAEDLDAHVQAVRVRVPGEGAQP